MSDAAAALPPAPSPERPRLQSIGTAFMSVATVMFFAGMIGYYLSQRAEARSSGGQWLVDIRIPLTAPNVMMATLVMSVVTITWSYYAIVRGDRPNGYLAMGITLLFGVAFINSQAYLYSQMNIGIRDSLQGVLIYTITGAYIFFLGVAMAYVGVTMFKALAGQYDQTQHDGLLGALIYWYVLVAIFAVIWLAIYITK
jgi:cytochrome c oxidase subunit III